MSASPPRCPAGSVSAITVPFLLRLRFERGECVLRLPCPPNSTSLSTVVDWETDPEGIECCLQLHTDEACASARFSKSVSHEQVARGPKSHVGETVGDFDTFAAARLALECTECRETPGRRASASTLDRGLRCDTEKPSS
jgi:hypothetical protein